MSLTKPRAAVVGEGTPKALPICSCGLFDATSAKRSFQFLLGVFVCPPLPSEPSGGLPATRPPHKNYAVLAEHRSGLGPAHLPGIQYIGLYFCTSRRRSPGQLWPNSGRLGSHAVEIAPEAADCEPTCIEIGDPRPELGEVASDSG